MIDDFQLVPKVPTKEILDAIMAASESYEWVPDGEGDERKQYYGLSIDEAKKVYAAALEAATISEKTQ
jgi:hypothetical protein